ncbi:hypothetical protein HDA40_001846 [Hamadaea flava]|uniref:Uncharacterized protein n=1 Tax=Hamadaea flava TaxID=1742688 RepID=A0ABV8LMP2_9ACTN|nr:hypothetical protein [Hamadaea flava]MCP2323339.1 hypothetical protein [Hamadaea flava]
MLIADLAYEPHIDYAAAHSALQAAGELTGCRSAVSRDRHQRLQVVKTNLNDTACPRRTHHPRQSADSRRVLKHLDFNPGDCPEFG